MISHGRHPGPRVRRGHARRRIRRARNVIAGLVSSAVLLTMIAVACDGDAVPVLAGPASSVTMGHAATTGRLTSAAADARQEPTLGRPLDIIERCHDMSLGINGIFPNAAEARLARNHLLFFSWVPGDWSTNTAYPWTLVASGALDRSVILPEADRLRAFGHRVFLTLAAEPDGAMPGEGTPAQFVAAWRHVHQVFARAGVRNVAWVWMTPGYVPHTATISALFPGDAYVDWIGYDPFNFLNCHHSSWQTFAQAVYPFYQWLLGQRIGRGKPLMLADFGSAAQPGDPDQEGAWFRSIAPVLRGLPRRKAPARWNASTPGCGRQLTADPEAASAYRLTGLSPYLRPARP